MDLGNAPLLKVRCLWGCCLLAAVVMATACRPAPAGHIPRDGAEELQAMILGRLVTDEPVLVAPGAQWVTGPKRRQWRLNASGTLAVYITAAPTAPLVVSVRPRRGDPSVLRCRWDGAPAAARWVRYLPHRLEVRVPRRRLAPGAHSLSLVRTDQLEVGAGDDDGRLEVSALHWRLGDRSGRIEPREVHRYHYIADLVQQGVTLSTKNERLDGMLLVGPHQLRIPLPRPTPGRLHFTVCNQSPADAVFTVAAGARSARAVVPAQGTAPLSITLDGAEQELGFATEGPAQGLFLWGAPRVAGPAAAPGTPIVLITLDTARRDQVPPYSGDDTLMPRLAALARQATVYRRAVATSPWTLPSHASMLTGLYPSRHRAGVTLQELAANRLTAPELLRHRGWYTAGFAGGFFCASRFGISQGFAVYHDPDGFEVPADRLTDEVLGFLDQATGTRPMLFVNYFDAHFPYHAPQRLRAAHGAPRRGAVAENSVWWRILDGDAGAFTTATVDDIPFPAPALAALRAEYRAELAFIDEQLGRLIDALRAHRLWDEALVIVVSDHGELLGEHRVLGHGGRLDPELVEVPLIVKSPHQGQPVTVHDVVSLVDLFPTMLAAAGVPAPPNQGVILPRSDGGPPPHDLVFSEEHAMGIHRLFGRLRVADDLYAIERTEQRQVVWRGGSECFRPVGEGWLETPCASPSPMALVEDRLSPPRLLSRHRTATVDDDDLDKLRALGYAR